MNDLSIFRKDATAIQRLARRSPKLSSQAQDLMRFDQEHRKLLQDIESIRASQNQISGEIGKAKATKNEARATELKAKASELKILLPEKQKTVDQVKAEIDRIMKSLPNIPDESVPFGQDEAANVELRKGIPPRQFEFQPLDHQEIGERLGILDFKAAAKLSGARFALWKGQGARLIRALGSYLLDYHTANGYLEVHPPYLVRRSVMEGTGQLPKFEEDLYQILPGPGNEALVPLLEDIKNLGSTPVRNIDSKALAVAKDHPGEYFLIPTSEVPLTNLVREEILSFGSLPLKFTALTPCFRKEAGAYGKDIRGVIRNHQFDKVELVWITTPESSSSALEKLTKNAESVLIDLGLPHRVIELCTGDIGFSAKKTYDIEVWMPSDNKYREISSCSNCGDFQARRMQARFRRDAESGTEFVHTLNGSGVAVGRLAAAILENFQQADCSVLIPQPLVRYFGSERIVVR